MKVTLSLAIPSWVGWAIGAITDDIFSDVWTIWSVVGFVLFLASLYTIKRS